MNDYKVYKHTTPSGKTYIGITRQDLPKRWKNGKGYEGCTAFYRAVNKYGWENIDHEVVADGLSKEAACIMEQELIKKYDSCNPEHGYNLTKGGEHYEPTEEWRERARAAHRQRYKDHPEERERISRRQIGRKASAATREKMSLARSKYIMEHPEARAQCGDSFRGKKRSEENRLKLRLANEKPIVCIETGERFASIGDAAKYAKVCRTSISNMLAGRSKTAGGYRFAFVTV